MKLHQEIVTSLQKEMLRLLKHKQPHQHIALKYNRGHSNTTRSKSYKKNCLYLHCGPFNRLLSIDVAAKRVVVEPRMTMEEIVDALIPYGLTIPVVPEFKGITVGGAIMGAAGESSSFLYGTFNDCCLSYELLCGNGEIVTVTKERHPNLFYGIPGSYGSLGALLSVEIKLIAVKKFVKTKIHFLKPAEAVKKLCSLIDSNPKPEFVDGIVFSRECAAIIEGSIASEEECQQLPHFSTKHTFSKWYAEHLFAMSQKGKRTFEEKMELKDYLFRYDKGAFWMGSYFFYPTLVYKLLSQGIFNISQPKLDHFDEKESKTYSNALVSNLFKRSILSPLMASQRLWSILHQSEKWVQERFIIQDFCIPSENASKFLTCVIDSAAVFPLWLCPIKGAGRQQIFAPHLTQNENEAVINIGVYGAPSHSQPLSDLTKFLEKLTQGFQGRKVLYSRSYYSEEEFWDIYAKHEYQQLRESTGSSKIWHDITSKVLSE